VLTSPNNFAFRVKLSEPSPAAITALVNTAPRGVSAAEAEPGVDFVPVANAFFGLPPNTTSGIITVQILPDNTIEPQEYLSLILSNIAGAQPDTVTTRGFIANDDGPPQLTVYDASVTEPTGGSSVYTLAQFRVNLSHPNYTTDTTVQIRTRNDTALASGGGVLRDYDPVQTTLTIPPNTTLKSFQVAVRGDAVQEGTERFFVDFSNPVKVTLPDAVAIGTILQSTQATGLFSLSSPGERITVDEVVPLSIEWTVPAGKVWRDLESIDLRLRHGGGVDLWVRWDEATNAFTLVEPERKPRNHPRRGRKRDNGPSTGVPVGEPAQPGSDTVLETKQARLHLDGTTVEGSGPTGQTVTLNLSVSFPIKSAGHAYVVEVAATSDSGDDDAFVGTGSIRIDPRRR
jgi:hypothetical protein